MNKFQAIHFYWNRFGLLAYNENSVPSDAKYKYITYESATGSLDGKMVLNASIWDRNTSWAPIMQEVIRIEPLIDANIKVDGGYVIFRKPEASFAQPMGDSTDDKIRRIVLAVEVEFLTA